MAREMQPFRSVQPKAPLLSFQSLPVALRPLIRAYLLGYASAVAPRLLTLVLQYISKKRKNSRKYLLADKDDKSFRDSALKILRTGFDLQRFPAFCAVLVGGSTLLQEPLLEVVNRVATEFGVETRLRTDLIHLLPPLTKRYAGRTLDLTLFAVTRAVDVLVGELWSQHRSRRKMASKWTFIEQFLSRIMDPAVFAASSGLIMWAWFYSPESLPRSYNKWITSAASVDLRLIEALRRCRSGELIYGQDTGQAPLLGSMCADYGMPTEWGDPAQAIPFPCDIVHMGTSSSCEYHALSRFLRSWRWSMFTYLPLALALQLRRPKKMNLMRAIVSSTRSSTFLAMFITLFYYGVCLSRTRLGPHILGKDVPARQRIDEGVCVCTGCCLCGWSVLFETASRRKDMALFVAPRALATLVPRKYPLEKQWREKLVFAASTAVVFTCAMENPKRVRGVLGSLLAKVLKA